MPESVTVTSEEMEEQVNILRRIVRNAQISLGISSAVILSGVAALWVWRQNFDSDQIQKNINFVNYSTENGVGVSQMKLTLPEELTKHDFSKTIDFSNPEAIAKKMNVFLTGDPHQVLYEIKVEVPDLKNEQYIPVTVETVHAFSQVLNALENSLVTRHRRRAPEGGQAR